MGFFRYDFDAMNNVKTAERRKVHFENLDEILQDAKAVTAGPHRVTGNWTAAQNIHHVAWTIGASNNGFDIKIPLAMKLFGKTLRVLGKHLKPINPGINPPKKVAEAFAPPDQVTLDDALGLLDKEVEAAKNGGMTYPSPLFGDLSPEEWEAVHCRHAELHLSFIHPDA